jgi:hypothetical protein
MLLFHVAAQTNRSTVGRQGGAFMTQFRKRLRNLEVSGNLAEADALLFENAELRKTAADLMLQTAILREALLSDERRRRTISTNIGFRN